MMDEESGEVLVTQDAQHSGIQIHIRGRTPDEYRVIRLDRHEARRLAALILFQAERVGSAVRRPAGEWLERGVGLKSA